MTNEDSDTLVWHYTTADGILGMIRDREIWATHSRFMNDKVEGEVMHAAISNFIESKGDLPPSQMSMIEMQYSFLTSNMYPHNTRVPAGNMFLLCGSRDNDALTLWRNYAREEVSFAVGLNPNAPLGIIQSEKHQSPRTRDVAPWRDVEYTSEFDKLPQHLAMSLREAAQSRDQGDQIVNISSELRRILSGVKHSAFEDERETRAAFFCDGTIDWHFRSGRFGITPYVKIGTSDRWGLSSDRSRRLPIEAIRLSANATEADILALNALLESNGFAFGTIYDEFLDENGFATHGSVGYEHPLPVSQSRHPLRG